LPSKVKALQELNQQMCVVCAHTFAEGPWVRAESPFQTGAGERRPTCPRESLQWKEAVLE